MEKLQIVRVDNDLVQKTDLQIGNNIIGRGVVTGCDEGRVVKHAVTINLAPNNEMTITPVSPCYMKSIGSTRWKLLKLGDTVPIKPGDVCSLLPDKCWFKVISVPGTMENDQEHASKRKADQDLEPSTPDKKSCTESKEEEGTSACVTLNEILDINNDNNKVKDEENTVNNVMCNKEAGDTGISYLKSSCDKSDATKEDTKFVREVCNAQSLDQSVTLKNGDCKNEDININKMATSELRQNLKKNLDAYLQSKNDLPAAAEDIHLSVPMQVDEPSASANVTSGSRREKCRYGKKCYRKNPQHKDEFSHPGDSDYDIPDNREECPYGTRCYRKNPQHKLQFKHTTIKSRRKRILAKNANVALSESEESSAEESVDESEYEPSSDIESVDEDDADWDQNESDLDECDDGTTG